MDALSAQEPLLPSNGGDHGSVSMEKKTELAFSLSLVVKWILKIIMSLVFIAWIAFILAYPLNSGNNLVKKWTHESVGTFLGIEGPALLIFSCPVFIIAILSVPYLAISGKDKLQEKEKSTQTTYPSYRLSTSPLLVDGHLGVVSVSEFIVILVFALSIIWAVYVYTSRNLSTIDETELTSDTEKICRTLQVFGISLGLVGLFCLAFLFLPIARGSALLRLIDVPFGHAVRYHVWLGNLTMFIFTLHGLFFIIAWLLSGDILENILEWPDSGVVNLAGVIALTAGLLMWITSLPVVRKHYFQLFFYTHQLYIILVIFLALHVGVIFFSMAAGTIFLYMIDRFLRFSQSRKSVDIVSATCFPGGIVNLVLSKPKNLQCDALSFIFLQVPQVSLLQWHPFSVSSTSLEGEHHLCILIKVVGQWTAKLKENISNISRLHMPDQEGMNLQSRSKLTASVEGPYGHELQKHLMYEKLVLIAGGIGISPFLAVLSDFFHRIRHRRPCLLKNMVVVWAVKGSAELSLLSMVDKKLSKTCFSNEVNLDILIYVTQESEPPLEDGAVDRKAINTYVWPRSTRNKMSTLVGKSSDMWFGIYLISTIVGFIVLLCLLNIFYINPYSIPTGWYEGLLFVACMVASVLICGGFVVGLWHLWESKSLQSNCEVGFQEIDIAQDNIEPASGNDHGSSTTIRYGSRPNFQDIFESISAQWGSADVGVIVCGPPTLEKSVAKECKSSNTRRQQCHPIFHFHSHSFSL